MMQIKIIGISVDKLAVVREFFKTYIDREVLVVERGELIDLVIRDSVPVILKYNYPDFSLHLGGWILSLNSKDYIFVEIR